MAAKGAEAKEYVAKKLKEVFGEDYIGEVDKKYYVWSHEGGQKMQIAIAMTCPKTPISEVETVTGSFDWSSSANANEKPTSYEPAKITDDERNKVAELMAKLGL